MPILGLYVLLLSAVQCPGCVALTRVCERDLQSVGVAEAFAKWRNNGLCRSFAQHYILVWSLPAPLLLGLAYHNQRAEAANDQTPEDGGLVARGPVDVLAGRGPEGNGRHCEMCVWYVVGVRVAQEV